VIQLAGLVDVVLRSLILTAAVAAGLVALTHWAVRSQYLQPFGSWPRLVRRLSDPLLLPIERRLVRLGRNPQEAPFWLFGAVVIGGILLLSLSRWLMSFGFTVAALRHASPAVWLRFGVALVFNVLILALMVRVLGSWFGLSRFRGVGRPAWLLTDWLVEPIRRRLPPFGPLDLSPLVAYFALVLLRALVFSLLA
jgi:YggT family protein